MNDYIEINELIVFANHGVLPEEKSMGQRFAISLKLYYNMEYAAAGDDLDKAVNYAEVCSFVTEFTKKNRCMLIETAAKNIADSLLICYPILSRVDIRLKKPWAPIGLPLDSVSVNISRKRSVAYIGMGSNIGDKKAYLDYALTYLRESGTCNVRKVSSYIVTEPYGGVEQDDFLNACIELDTVLSPDELLGLLHEIENSAGRTREIHWGPRTLDLDILLFEDSVISTDTLTVPHPGLAKREFVLEPLSEIAPYAYHPVSREYMITMYESLKEKNRNGNT